MTPAFKIGTVLENRYKLEELIGSGGESYVFRAKDRHMGRPAAIRQY